MEAVSTGRLLLVALALVTSGCHATGPRFAGYDPISEGEGRLYVYRSAESSRDLDEVAFAIDDARLVNLDIGGYATARLRPGIYRMSAWFDGWGLDLEPAIDRDFRVARGRAVFCRFSSSRGLVIGERALECSDDAEAHAELRACRLQPLDADAPWDP